MERFLDSRSLEVVEINTTLSLLTQPEWDALSDELVGIEKRWPRRPVDLLGGAATDDNLGLSHLQLSVEKRTGEGSTNLELELNYTQHHLAKRIPARRLRKLQDDHASLNRTLSLLGEFSQEAHLHCTCHWNFSRDLISTVIQFPLLQIPVPGTRMTEINGVKFTDPLKSEYVVLDLINSDNIHMAAYFAFHQGISSDIINTVVARGEVIREAFISPREGREE